MVSLKEWIKSEIVKKLFEIKAIYVDDIRDRSASLLG
jgi:hypothetical protein